MSFLGELLRHRVLFFGGKGGVGKSTIAAAAALYSSENDFKTLLVSTDPAHSTSDVLECKPAKEITTVLNNFDLLEIDPEQEVDDYIAGVKDRITASTPPRLIAEVDRQLDIARLSPGAEESALFDRITRILKDEGDGYDRIIFDTAPTGHTVRLLSLPETMTAWIGGLIGNRKKVNALARMWRNVTNAPHGSNVDREDPVLTALEDRKNRFHNTRQIVTDSKLTAFVFVVIAERLPILETERAVKALDKHRIPVGGIVINRVLPQETEEPFLRSRRDREAGYLGDIDSKFKKYASQKVPLLTSDVVGLEHLRTLILHLDGRGHLDEPS